MSYAKTSLSEIDPHETDEGIPTVRSVGYELRPDEMRLNVWDFEPGETLPRHRQETQEELYVVLEGELAIDVDGEAVTASAGDYVVVPPASWRELRATADTRLLAVGAPNVPDDGIMADDEP